MIRFLFSLVLSIAIVWCGFRRLTPPADIGLPMPKQTISSLSPPAAVSMIAPPAPAPPLDGVPVPLLESGQEPIVAATHSGSKAESADRRNSGVFGTGRQVLLDESVLERLDDWIARGECELAWVPKSPRDGEAAIICISAAGIFKGDANERWRFNGTGGIRVQLDQDSSWQVRLAAALGVPTDSARGSIVLLFPRTLPTGLNGDATVRLSADDSGLPRITDGASP